MPQTIVLIPSLTSSGGTPLPSYRDLLADELGFRLETTVTTTASSGEARRVVLADDFRDDEVGSMLVEGSSAYLYVLDGDQAGSQSRLVSQSDAGYQGTRSATVLARPLDAPLEAGTRVLVTGPLPVKRYLTVKGLDDCVNEGLARCPAQAMLLLALTGGSSDRVSLADYPYITHVDQILGVYDYYGTAATQAARPTGLPYRIDADGTTRDLVLGRSYTSGETVALSVSLPGDHLIHSGIAWGYPTTPGLHRDIQSAAVPDHWVLAFGMVAALRFLQRQTLRRSDLDKEVRAHQIEEIGSRLGQWSITANRLRLTEFPRGLPRRSASLLGTTLTSTDSTITDPVGSSWP